MTHSQRRQRDRNLNKANGIIDIDDLPAQVGDGIRDILSSVRLVDIYSGDVVTMLKVINQQIKRTDAFTSKIEAVAKQLTDLIEWGEK